MENLESLDRLLSKIQALCTTYYKTLATAESCTGGFIAHKITLREGASSFYAGGIVCYTDAVKQNVLNVPQKVLVEHTAVSPEVAALMAQGVAQKFRANVALATTGYASLNTLAARQSGGLCVYTAAMVEGSPPSVQKHIYPPTSSRLEVIKHSSCAALVLLLQKLS